MSGTSPEKDLLLTPKQKLDETQTENTRIQATHTPKSKNESPDQNQQSQWRSRRPQQSESKRSHTSQSSEEPRITSPEAVVNVASIYKPNQSDQIQRQVYPQEAKHVITTNPKKSEMMEKKFKSSKEDSQSHTAKQDSTGSSSFWIIYVNGTKVGEDAKNV